MDFRADRIIVNDFVDAYFSAEPKITAEDTGPQTVQHMKRVYSDGFVNGYNYRQSSEPKDNNAFHGHTSSVLNQCLSFVIKAQIPQANTKMFSHYLQIFYPTLTTLSQMIETNPQSYSEEQGKLCKLAECLLSFEISKRDDKTVQPPNLIERMDAVNVSFDNFERKSALLVFLAFNYIEKPTLDQVELCIEHCDLMLYNSDKLEPSDLTCMAMILFNIHKKQPSCLQLLGDAFILSSFANVIDPVGAEVFMVEIGNAFIGKTKQTFSSLIAQLSEFISRRISTSNLGSLCFSSNTFCEILYSNIFNKLRPEIIPSASYKFGEDLKCLTRKEFKSQYFLEDLLRIESSKDPNEQMLSLYKIINNTYLSADSSQAKAHKLALVCKLVVNKQLDIDRNEFLNALLVCIHNFHIIFETEQEGYFSVSTESLPISGNNTAVSFDLYCFSILELYKLLTADSCHLKYPAAEKCFYFKNINNRFFQILWKKVLENLQLLERKIKEQTPKDSSHYLTKIMTAAVKISHNCQLAELNSNIEYFKGLAEQNQTIVQKQIEMAKFRLSLLKQSNLSAHEIEIIKAYGVEMQPATEQDKEFFEIEQDKE